MHALRLSHALVYLIFCLTLPYGFAFGVETEEAVTTRLHNIHLMRNVLKINEYKGYDIIIVSSTSKQEAEYQQKTLENAFAGTSKKNGRQPIILSVVDSIEGGQLIGCVNTWLQAEEMMVVKYPTEMKYYHSLLDYVKKNKLKVATYHNGGKGERCSPLTQSLGNSRGSQKLVGTIRNALNEEIELDILLSVVLQCSSFAATNHGTHLDTFWTSQIAFGSHPHDHLVRSNFQLDKFLVGFSKEQLIAQNIADFGTAALSKSGRMIAFYGNKRFASRKGSHYVIDAPKIEKELLNKGDRVAYDFGSFSTRLEMWQLIVDFWKRKGLYNGSLTKIKRDIDPHFIQPFIRFLHALSDLTDRQFIDERLPNPASLISNERLKEACGNFDQFLKDRVPNAYTYIWEELNQETDLKKKAEAIACMHEVMEFYLLYHQKHSLRNLEKVFGYIDLGDETQWFRYRRPIDIMNEKFEMLTDLVGNKMETQLDGSILESEANESSLQRSYEARLMRGINHDNLVHFTVEGKPVTMSYEEVKRGNTVEDIYVKNSVIQNCDLSRGSSIVNSVLNHVTGKVIANNSYLETSSSPYIEVETSLIHLVTEQHQIIADCEVVSDVYKSKLNPPYHGRMRAPIGYDPKGMPLYKQSQKTENGILTIVQELDETIGYFVEKIPYDLGKAQDYSDKNAKTEDGRYTFEEIREIEPLRIEDHLLMEAFQKSIKAQIQKG